MIAERVCFCKNSLHHLMGRGEGGFLMETIGLSEKGKQGIRSLRKKKEFVPFRRKDL